MRNLLLLLLFLSLSGCAGMNEFSPERWVENNTLYSTKSPGIEIKAAPFLTFEQAGKKDGLTSSDESSYTSTGKDFDWFAFSDSSKKKRLVVKIETITDHAGRSMSAPDYSQDPASLVYGDETIGGINFTTGIIKGNIQGRPVLIKMFWAVVGETTSYEILYVENADSKWLEKSSSALSKHDHVFLAAFNKRANDSFSIASYSGFRPPTKKNYPLSP